MQKADQGALLHNTNIALVAIRQAELNYYASFYLTFGGQASLIGGFAYGSLTQIHYPATPTYANYYIIKTIFWISTAICLGSSLHCVLTAIFLQVLGPGLALHGPVGSMAKAADGMRAEIQATFVAYVVMVVSLAVSTIMSFWVLMTVGAASVSTVLFLLGMMMWWKYCLRIYNTFFVHFADVQFREMMSQGKYLASDMRQGEEEEPGADVIPVSSSSSSSSTGTDGGVVSTPPPSASSTAAASAAAGTSSNGSTSSRWFGRFTTTSTTTSSSSTATSSTAGRARPPFQLFAKSKSASPVSAKRDSDVELRLTSKRDFRDVVLQGYLTKKSGKQGVASQRRFFVLLRTGYLFYYLSKRAFTDAPTAPIKDRGIRLQDHVVKVVEAGVSGEGGGGDAGSEFLKCIQLVPTTTENERGRVWEFRCDGDEEHDMWVSELSAFASRN